MYAVSLTINSVAFKSWIVSKKLKAKTKLPCHYFNEKEARVGVCITFSETLSQFLNVDEETGKNGNKNIGSQ